MKYVCRKNCQHRDNGKIRFCERGRVYEFAEKPKFGFDTIGEKSEPDYKLDFLTASEEELKKTKWSFDDASDAIQAAYGVELFREEGTRKSEVIDQILDARFRSVEVKVESTVNLAKEQK